MRRYIYTTLQTIASKAGDSLNEIWKIDKVALLVAEALKQKSDVLITFHSRLQKERKKGTFCNIFSHWRILFFC